MQDKFDTLRVQFRHDLRSIHTLQDVEELKTRYLGRKGPVQSLMQGLRDLTAQERPLFGKLVNELKEELEKLNQKLASLEKVVEKASQQFQQQQENYRNQNTTQNQTTEGERSAAKPKEKKIVGDYVDFEEIENKYF